MVELRRYIHVRQNFARDKNRASLYVRTSLPSVGYFAFTCCRVCTASKSADDMTENNVAASPSSVPAEVVTMTTSMTSSMTSPTGAMTKVAELCAGCRQPITERYLLRALESSWHEDCLRCSCCDCRLGEVGSTLFTRSNLMLCRRDYLRSVHQLAVLWLIPSLHDRANIEQMYSKYTYELLDVCSMVGTFI